MGPLLLFVYRLIAFRLKGHFMNVTALILINLYRIVGILPLVVIAEKLYLNCESVHNIALLFSLVGIQLMITQSFHNI